MLCFGLCLACLFVFIMFTCLFEIGVGKWYLIFEWDDDRYLQVFNWLDRGCRYWGYREDWYDGPRPSFGFWFFNAAWR